MTRLTVMALAALALAAPAALSQQQSIVRVDRDDTYDYGYEYGDQAQIDRYLGVEIWPNHHDGEYYEGDRIVLNFRANRDAFVAIYSIDSRGRVNLLFPAGPNEDNFVQGGVTHRLPASQADYDLVVSGPEGVENIQIVASREPFPIPDWYPVSGIMAEGDDRMAYMDYLNDRYFVGYGGQRFAYDRTAIHVNEWEEYYFQPVYYPVYHPWTLAGNVYIDYPFGATVYINGIYWGCTPLYLPRVYVGWHTITVIDHWGYCWESDIHVSRYHTLVLDHHHIRPAPHVKSKYREVVVAGYRDPVKNGYPDYVARTKQIASAKGVRTEEVAVQRPSGERTVEKVAIGPKTHVRGATNLVKTDRGFETAGLVPDWAESSYSRSSKKFTAGSEGRSTKPSDGYQGPGSGYASGKRDVVVGKDGQTESKNQGGAVTQERERTSSEYYQRKSGSDAGRSGFKENAQRREVEVNQGRSKGSSGSRPSYKPSDGGSSKGKGATVAPPSKPSGGSSPSGKSSGGSGTVKSGGGGGKGK
ncbi:MAG TPA: DUF4384 domain-containing protein, partial [candidate division Zixibacteria bacterium]|nr:DUF4384 domain-containing protein [candidate division Zixibacteria bacterium]